MTPYVYCVWWQVECGLCPATVLRADCAVKGCVLAYGFIDRRKAAEGPTSPCERMVHASRRCPRCSKYGSATSSDAGRAVGSADMVMRAGASSAGWRVAGVLRC